MKLRLYALIITTASIQVIFAQNSNLNSGWLGPSKHITNNSEGTKLAVIGQDFLHIFETSTFFQTHLFKQFKNLISCEFLNETELIVLTASGTYNIELTEETITKIFSESFNAIDTDPENQLIFLGNEEGMLSIYSVKSEKILLLKTINTASKINSLTSSDHYLIIGHESGQISIYDKKKYTLANTLIGHQTAINSLALSPSGNILASTSRRQFSQSKTGEGIIWNLNKKEVIFRTEQNYNQIQDCFIDNQGRIFFGTSREIIVFDSSGYRKKSLEIRPFNDPIFTSIGNNLVYSITSTSRGSRDLYLVDFNKGRDQLIRSFGPNSTQIWDISSTEDNILILKEEELSSIYSDGKSKTIPFSEKQPLKFHDNKAYGFNNTSESVVTYNPKNDTLINISIPSNTHYRIFSSDIVTDNDSLLVLGNDALYNDSSDELLVDFKDTQKKYRYASGVDRENAKSDQNTIRMFIDPKTFYELNQTKKVLNIRSNRDGSYLFQISHVEKILHIERNKLIIKGSINGVNSIGLIDIELRSVKSLFPISKYPQIDQVNAIKFSSDYSKLAYRKGDNFRVLFLDVKKEISISPPSQYNDAFDFSPNDTKLLTGNRFGELEIWDLETGAFKGTLFFARDSEEYCILTDTQYDGSDKGVEILIQKNAKEVRSRGQNLLKSMLFN